MPCLRRAASASSRKTGSGASASASSASTRCVPAPWRAIVVEPHSGHVARHRLAVAAVVADEALRAAGTVQRQRHVAARAAPGVPARAADARKAAQPRRLTSTIALPPRRLHLARARRASRDAARGAGRACRAARPAGSARPVRRARAASSRRIASQLSGRGVALPHSSTAPAGSRAPRGDPPRVVAGVALLLVGGVVLLVDDDQAEVAQRREHRRARARRRRAPRRGAAAATRRSARPCPSFECSTATRSPKRSLEAARRSAA